MLVALAEKPESSGEAPPSRPVREMQNSGHVTPGDHDAQSSRMNPNHDHCRRIRGVRLASNLHHSTHAGVLLPGEEDASVSSRYEDRIVLGWWYS
ncbi:unnamed protein product [Darwinula stevensoni]|uniref:Uncharacterized protein n=1 Tax=Darwinula stevensoni TaxID=69355 RepID=A0A7R8XK71_9CRUS|nr:unnamed protein product [Darwinula stevensoni]CAG0894914.1 unnamed protein product [Darwinula stevensoni]